MAAKQAGFSSVGYGEHQSFHCGGYTTCNYTEMAGPSLDDLLTGLINSIAVVSIYNVGPLLLIVYRHQG